MIALDNALYSASEEVAKFKWALIMDVREARQEPSWQGSKPRFDPTEGR
jgi:hypothetical protein